MEHLYVKFANPVAVSVLKYRAERQTDTQTNGGENRTPATAVSAVGVVKYFPVVTLTTW